MQAARLHLSHCTSPTSLHSSTSRPYFLYRFPAQSRRCFEAAEKEVWGLAWVASQLLIHHSSRLFQLQLKQWRTSWQLAVSRLPGPATRRTRACAAGVQAAGPPGSCCCALSSLQPGLPCQKVSAEATSQSEAATAAVRFTRQRSSTTHSMPQNTNSPSWNISLRRPWVGPVAAATAAGGR